MRVGRGDAVRRVERDPAKIRNKSLRPGVAGLLVGDAIGAMEVAADIARRHTEAARSRDEDVADVLAHAALERESLGGRGRGAGRGRVERHVGVEPLHQIMHRLQRIAGSVLACGLGKFRDRRVDMRQHRLAQIEARREALDRTLHHAVGVLRLDLALHRQAQFGERPIHGEDVADVAERVLVLGKLAVLRHVDAPADDILAVVIARRQPQRLNHRAGRLGVPIACRMRDADSHVSAAISRSSCPAIAAPRTASLRSPMAPGIHVLDLHTLKAWMAHATRARPSCVALFEGRKSGKPDLR